MNIKRSIAKIGSIIKAAIIAPIHNPTTVKHPILNRSFLAGTDIRQNHLNAENSLIFTHAKKMIDAIIMKMIKQNHALNANKITSSIINNYLLLKVFGQGKSYGI